MEIRTLLAFFLEGLYFIVIGDTWIDVVVVIVVVIENNLLKLQFRQ
jgi:hypothetical protein